jgi:hypothetical protein
MMSLERKLLGRWHNGDLLPEEYMQLMKETKELLAQPEQTEPEPEPEPVGIVKTIGGYPDQSEHTVELTCRHGDLKDGDLLYKAPQKREPLSGREISHGFRINPDATHAESYWAGVEYAEKHHKIGGGE